MSNLKLAFDPTNVPLSPEEEERLPPRLLAAKAVSDGAATCPRRFGCSLQQ